MKKILSFISLAVFFSFSLPVSAEITTYETYVATEENLISVKGEDPGEQLGAAIEVGDFNNDGIDDLVVGSPFSSSSLKDWNGSVSIIFGSNDAQKGNLSIDHSPADISFYGERSGDQLGTSIVVGDFNDDGWDDIAIGAHNALIDENRTGKVYMVYGSSEWEKRSFDFSFTDPDVLFMGHSDGDDFGLELHAADINNNGVDDLLIGAPEAFGPDNTRTGAVYAFFGLEDGFEADIYNVGSSLADVNFYGHEKGERFGSVIESGYVTNEEKRDLVIGAYKSDVEDWDEAGRIYLYAGRNHYLKTLKSATSRIESNQSNVWFGFDIAIADMNDDGRDDIAVSSFPYLTNNRTGNVLVFFGGNRFGHIGSSYSVDKYDIIVDSPVGELYLGASLLLDDFDDDGRADLFVGAPGIGRPGSSEAGDVYALFSQGEEFLRTYSVRAKTINSTIHGLNADDWFGYRTASLDFDGDGHLDLAVGARYADSDKSINNGQVYLFLGDSAPFGKLKTVVNPGDRYLARAEFIAMVLDSFDLETENDGFIEQCYSHLEFCLFNFMAMSRYDDINLDPASLQLYPDVDPGYQYYEDINLATILGLINGYMNEGNSPFKPDAELSRIQALKVILGANGLVENKYQFELEEGSQLSSYFEDVNSEISHMWWYSRYTDFAVDKGIIKDGRFFRPDDKITYTEAVEFIEKTASYLNSDDTET